VRLSHTGYGELTTAILLANLVPAFGYLLQTGEIHRLITLSTFPLTALLLAMMVAIEFPDYGTDLKFQKKTLLTRVGWESGMTMHHIFILGAYLFLGLALVNGLPRWIALPAFLSLPLGLWQIWYMRRIAGGIKPNWTALTTNAVMLFASTSLLLAFSFWTK
jgi:1,4-dihydroxy-2-naphthoate octaprenyltransferase